MINHNPSGFLFDLDGVIIDSEREYTKIWKAINLEFPTGHPNLETEIKGCTLDKILTDHYPDLEIRKGVVSRLYELESRMSYDYLPGADIFLEELKRRSLPMALVTSSNNDKMAHLKEELPELMGKFDFVVTANLISRSKPDPEGYLLGAEKIKRKIENCVVFEDSLQGVMAGRNAGAYVVGIAGTLPAEVLAPYSDEVVDSLSEINLDRLLQKITER